MTTETFGLPPGYRYGEPWYTNRDCHTLAVDVYREDGKEPICTAFFRSLIPLGTPSFPDNAMLTSVQASCVQHDDEAARDWVPDACEAYGGTAVWLDGWGTRLSYLHGRWRDRVSGQPVPVT